MSVMLAFNEANFSLCHLSYFLMSLTFAIHYRVLKGAERQGV